MDQRKRMLGQDEDDQQLGKLIEEKVERPIRESSFADLLRRSMPAGQPTAAPSQAERGMKGAIDAGYDQGQNMAPKEQPMPSAGMGASQRDKYNQILDNIVADSKNEEKQKQLQQELKRAEQERLMNSLGLTKGKR